MRTLRAIIADDEIACRETLLYYINTYCTGIDVIAATADVPSSIEAIKKLQPDLVFLDVEMPFGNAFDVLEQTKDCEFQTIFVTAYSDYALRALNSSAAYYLLKPVNIEELVLAVQKVQQLNSDDAALSRETLKSNFQSERLRKILIPTLSGLEIVKLEEVIRFSGNGNYTDIHLTGLRKKTVSRVLKHFDELLQNEGFIRVHKSHMVNVDQIQAWHRGKGGYLQMSDGSEVEVSPARRDDILKALES